MTVCLFEYQKGKKKKKERENLNSVPTAKKGESYNIAGAMSETGSV